MDGVKRVSTEFSVISFSIFKSFLSLFGLSHTSEIPIKSFRSSNQSEYKNYLLDNLNWNFLFLGSLNRRHSLCLVIDPTKGINLLTVQTKCSNTTGRLLY